MCAALETLNDVCLRGARSATPNRRGSQQAMHDYITTTIQFGVDQIQEIYEVGPSSPRSEDRDGRLPGRDDDQVES